MINGTQLKHVVKFNLKGIQACWKEIQLMENKEILLK